MCSDAIKLLYGMVITYGGKVWWEESLANWLVSSIWQKKVWRINRSANRLLIISTNLDGFSLANHGQFTKFTNVSPSQSFPPYSTWYNVFNAWFLDIRISTLNVLVTHQFIYQFLSRQNFPCTTNYRLIIQSDHTSLSSSGFLMIFCVGVPLYDILRYRNTVGYPCMM